MSKDNTNQEEKTVTVKSVIVAFGVLGFYLIVWVGLPMLGIGEFSLTNFFFMFGTMIIGSLINIYMKVNPDKPIPKKPSRQLANLLKATADVAVNHLQKETPITKEIEDRLEKMIMWSLREAEASPEVDIEAIEDAKQYIFKQFSEKNKRDEE
jgi:hypothetical protein